MRISDIPDNTIVKGLNNQLYHLVYWDTYDMVKERYWLYTVDENYKRMFSVHEPAGLRCESADHLTIITHLGFGFAQPSV